MNKKVTIGVVILILVVVITGFIYFNKEYTLVNLEGFPSISTIEGASISSVEYLSEDDFYLYTFNENELAELIELLSKQSVKKVFGNKKLTSEYDLLLSTSQKRHIFAISDNEINIGYNQTYSFTDDTVINFLKETANIK